MDKGKGHEKQSESASSVVYSWAGREMRFVGHTAGDLGLAPCPTGSHLVTAVGQALLCSVVAAWQRWDTPGNDAGDTDTSGAHQTIYD
ncbi:hypothetical protein DHEL01_v206078 [Diaporthe helianthi]|uniref:Uncharacterized protein n=1 Tax=Diaporthe helianthi TaxID=158607 RepID=A0A2P5HZ65_DIAHE|nr:hypothetical protein DHEL01_v206078 [Diaporthe helianthi]